MITQESLDEAAQAAGYDSWDYFIDNCGSSFMYRSITSHAGTLDKLLGREPVDPIKALAAEMADNGFVGTLVDFAEAAIRKGQTIAPKAEPKPWTVVEIDKVWSDATAAYCRAEFHKLFRAHLKERGE